MLLTVLRPAINSSGHHHAPDDGSWPRITDAALDPCQMHNVDEAGSTRAHPARITPPAYVDDRRRSLTTLTTSEPLTPFQSSGLGGSLL